MGHRKQRKRARKQTARQWDDERLFSTQVVEPDWSFSGRDEMPPAWQWQDAFGDSRRTDVRTCGGCREFVEESENGRGTCLHPGSGVLSPWSDTEACPFYVGRRR